MPEFSLSWSPGSMGLRFFLGRDMLLRAHRLGDSRARRAGFTLAELLVVITVIALLLAIVSTSYRSARERAVQVVCGCRLRQWGVSFSCYAAENAGMWPHCDGLDRGPRDIGDPHINKEDLADWHGWVDLLPSVLALKPWRDYPRYERPNETTFFQCPAGRPLSGKGLYDYLPARDGYFSFAMNSCLELDANAWPPPGHIGYPMPSFLDTAKITSPQRVVLLFDQLLDPHRGFDGQGRFRSAGKYSGSYPKAFAARHRRNQVGLGGNILHCDGHTEWRKSAWKTHWDSSQEVPPRDDPDWYPYPAVAAGPS